MKRLHYIAAFALALVVTGGTLSESEAQRRGRQSARAIQIDENADGLKDGQSLRHRRGGHKLGRVAFAGQLTQEQRAALKEQIGALRDGGASAEDIAAALAAELTAAGVELPEGFAERAAERETRRIARQAERAEIKTLVEGLKAEGATRAEIRQALADAGFEKPRRGRRGGHRGAEPAAAPAAE